MGTLHEMRILSVVSAFDCVETTIFIALLHVLHITNVTRL